jgi:hypothetical protein
VVCELVDTDASLDKCLEEVAKWQMPYSLRRLFAIIMVFCEASNIVICGINILNQCQKTTIAPCLII